MKTSKAWLDIGIISLFPEMFDSLNFGIPRLAKEKGDLDLHLYPLRDYSLDKHRNVDDKAYGGGPGMVMSVQPLKDAIIDAKKKQGNKATVVYLSPQGKRLNQAMLQTFIKKPRSLIVLCGRYEGIDERVIESQVDEEWSLGDIVLSGGEIAALAAIDALVRLIPGVVGNVESIEQDSFMNGLLDCPHYTRPETIDGMAVPGVLTSGDHNAIARWRQKQSLGRTWLRRPDLLEAYPLDESDKQLLDEFKNEHARS